MLCKSPEIIMLVPFRSTSVKTNESIGSDWAVTFMLKVFCERISSKFEVLTLWLFRSSDYIRLSILVLNSDRLDFTYLFIFMSISKIDSICSYVSIDLDKV